MPTYEYLCDSCGHQLELFQGFNDPVKRKCPACKASKLRRLIGAGAGVIFKGSGFYETDYRSDSYKSDAKKDTESSCTGKPESCSGPACSTPDAD